MNDRRGEKELTRLIERSAELKRDLVDFACSPRLKRSLAAAMLEAGLEEFEEADAIGIIGDRLMELAFGGRRETPASRSGQEGSRRM